MKGFKVFNPDWTCRSFQYEVGKTFTHEGKISLCGAGFHYCEKLQDCFGYYPFDPENKVAEIEALGEIERGDNKSVTNKIRIVRELTWQEVLEMVNTGKGNTGLGNSGNRNSGDGNSGNRNSGEFNSCNYSSGAFCSVEPAFLLFNKPSPISRNEFYSSRAYSICRQLEVVEKVDEGYKSVNYKEAWAKLWGSLSNDEKIIVQSIPNFDADVFEEITGIRV